MAPRDWIWFKEGYASEEKGPTDIAEWKFLISQLKTLKTKATLQVHSSPPKKQRGKTIAAAYTLAKTNYPTFPLTSTTRAHAGVALRRRVAVVPKNLAEISRVKK